MFCKVFFAVRFRDLHENPEAHIKFKAIYKKGTADVLLNDICFRFCFISIHFDTDLKIGLAE